MPPTYERNNRCVDVRVLSIKGGDVVTQWICIAGGGYHTLAEAAHALDDPAAFAEVEHYHRHHE
jgi:hypothetical protein